MRRRAGLLDLNLALVLVAGVLLGFGRALTNGFVEYDDPAYVTDNPQVVQGLSAHGMRWAFTEFYFANWHPLTWLSHMLDVELFGLSPAGHHATSVLLHAANAVLFFLFLRRSSNSTVPAFLAAALFAWHPLRVESVAWISERKDVLSGLFFFLVLLAWERYARAPSARRYLLALALFAAGLLAKPMLVSLPFVLLLLDRWPLQRQAKLRALLLEKAPFALLAVLSSLVTIAAQSAKGATATLERLPIAPRLENAVLAVFAYLRQTFWPADLACFYPHPVIAAEDAAARFPAVLFGTAVLAALTALLFLRRRRMAPWWSGWAAFLVMLLPVIGIVQVGSQSHADRYTYLPSTILTAGIVFGLAGTAFPALRRAFVALAAPALGILLVLSFRQVGVWKDTVQLFEHAAVVTPRNYLAHYRIGELYSERGENEAALEHFQEALAIRPDLPWVQNALGKLFLEAGDRERALACFKRARQLDPREALYTLNLAAAWIEAGELERAESLLEELARGGEDGAELHFDLGLVAQERGSPEDALRRYREALERDPDHRAALNNLGQMLLALGDAQGAVHEFERLAALEPSDPSVLFNLGVAQQAHGATELAREAYRRALALDPLFAPAVERLRQLDDRP